MAAGQAIRIAAYVKNHVIMAHSPPENFQDSRYDHILITSEATDRKGLVRVFDQTWVNFSNQLVAERVFNVLEENTNFILLSRINP